MIYVILYIFRCSFSHRQVRPPSSHNSPRSSHLAARFALSLMQRPSSTPFRYPCLTIGHNNNISAVDTRADPIATSCVYFQSRCRLSLHFIQWSNTMTPQSSSVQNFCQHILAPTHKEKERNRITIRGQQEQTSSDQQQKTPRVPHCITSHYLAIHVGCIVPGYKFSF